MQVQVQSSTTTNPQPQPQVWKVSEEGLVQVYKGCSYTMMLMMPRMLQQHSDIKVTDAAGINHIGKAHCANFDCKTESRADEWNQHSFLYSVQNPYSVFIWSRLRCLWRSPRGGLFADDYCVDNAENKGECNFNTWQQINRTKSLYSSKLQRCWGPEDP